MITHEEPVSTHPTLVAVIDAQGEGTIIRILDLPDSFEDEDLADPLAEQDYDRKAIILDDIPETIGELIITSFGFVTYTWANGRII